MLTVHSYEAQSFFVIPAALAITEPRPATIADQRLIFQMNGVAIIDVQGAAGSRFGRLILTNTSGQSCRTRGFIGGRLIAPGGAPLPTTIVHEAPSPPRRVIIRSGAAASVGAACTSAAGGDAAGSAIVGGSPRFANASGGASGEASGR